jgi:hypothetical protein
MDISAACQPSSICRPGFSASAVSDTATTDATHRHIAGRFWHNSRRQGLRQGARKQGNSPTEIRVREGGSTILASCLGDLGRERRVPFLFLGGPATSTVTRASQLSRRPTATTLPTPPHHRDHVSHISTPAGALLKVVAQAISEARFPSRPLSPGRPRCRNSGSQIQVDELAETRGRA